MTGADQRQLLTAEVRWGDDSGAILWVGTAPVHQFWPLLAPHFGDSFLPPQRRMEGDAVAWTWRGSQSDAPSSDDLAALRAKLAADRQKFGQSQNQSSADDSPRAKKNRENLALLLLLVEGFVGDLLAKSDPELARFVASTEAGLRIHSWGAKSAAQPLGPEQLGREVSGLALNSGKPATGVEVALEAVGGAFKASAQSDESGHFRFSNIARGRYRLTAHHDSMAFSAQGVEVSVESEPVTGLKLRAATPLGDPDPESESEPDSSEDAEPQPKRRRGPALSVAGAGAVAGLAWLFASGAPQRLIARLNPSAKVQSSAASSPQPASSAPQPPLVATSRSTTALRGQAPSASSHPGQAGSASPAAGGQTTSERRPAPSKAASQGGQVMSTPGPAAPAFPAGAPGQGPASFTDHAEGGQAASKAQSRAKTTGKTDAPRSEVAPKDRRARSDPQKPELTTNPKLPTLDQPSSPSAASTPDPTTPAKTPAPAPNGGWAHRTRISATAWKIRLLVDLILPTAPAGDTSVAALEALRQKLLAEQRAKIPATFQAPRTSRGYAVDLPDSALNAGFHWQIPPGSAAQSQIVSRRAELSWDDGVQLPAGKYALIDSAGQTWAQVDVARGQPAVFQSRTSVSAWCWFQVKVDASDTGGPGRFHWQLSSGETLPANWRQQRWGGQLRLEAPLIIAPGQAGTDRLALLDTASGWGLTTVVDQAAFSAL